MAALPRRRRAGVPRTGGWASTRCSCDAGGAAACRPGDVAHPVGCDRDAAGRDRHPTPGSGPALDALSHWLLLSRHPSSPPPWRRRLTALWPGGPGKVSVVDITGAAVRGDRRSPLVVVHRSGGLLLALVTVWVGRSAWHIRPAGTLGRPRTRADEATLLADAPPGPLSGYAGAQGCSGWCRARRHGPRRCRRRSRRRPTGCSAGSAAAGVPARAVGGDLRGRGRRAAPPAFKRGPTNPREAVRTAGRGRGPVAPQLLRNSSRGGGLPLVGARGMAWRADRVVAVVNDVSPGVRDRARLLESQTATRRGHPEYMVQRTSMFFAGARPGAGGRAGGAGGQAAGGARASPLAPSDAAVREDLQSPSQRSNDRQ